MSVAYVERYEIPNSAHPAPVGSVYKGPVPLDETLQLTVVLRQSPQLGRYLEERRQGGHRQRGFLHPSSPLRRNTGATPVRLRRMREVFEANGLSVVLAEPASRRLVLKGPISALGHVFGVTLSHFDYQGTVIHCHETAIRPVAALEEYVACVLGLDTRPVGRQRDAEGPTPEGPVSFMSAPAGASVKESLLASVPTGSPPYRPPDLAKAMGFPMERTGAGRHLAIVAFGGGYDVEIMETYFEEVLGHSGPTIVDHLVDGAKNAPDNTVDTVEVALDVQIAGSIVPDAKITVVFAPNTYSGWVNALLAVVEELEDVDVLSISWVAAETSWSASYRQQIDDAIAELVAAGVTITAASGDFGCDPRNGKVTVGYPASNPNLVSCGGTKVWLDESTGSVSREEAWSQSSGRGGATGGGISALYGVPTYQTGVSLPESLSGSGPGRGVPDVSGNADPNSGFLVLASSSNPSWSTQGGTSAAAPFWAAFFIQLAQARGTKLGAVNEALYAAGRSSYTDITVGDNSYGSVTGYTSVSGWDACTGLGSPVATELLSALTLSS